MYFAEYTESELIKLIEDQVEESLHLDYKRAKALNKIDNQRSEKVTRAVSAFANSDGGTIVYGIKEYDDDPRNPLPERVDAVDRGECSRETLEEIINSGIQPRIPEIKITPIKIQSPTGGVVYVVEIPKSNTAHQAKDKRYYRRYNFQSVAMYDYEIKDIINRQQLPLLRLVFKPSQTSLNNGRITFPLVLENLSLKVAKEVKFTIEVLNPSACTNVNKDGLNNLSNVNPGMVFGSQVDVSVYYGLALSLARLSFEPLPGEARFSFRAAIFADNVPPNVSQFSLVLSKDGKVDYEIEENGSFRRLIEGN